jgi:hypothetical protein
VTLFERDPHPRVEERAQAGPVRVADQRRPGINGRLALRLCAMVGTMPAAYVFAALALIALPGVLGWQLLPARTLLIVGWVSQTLIQLVMLAILQLGANLQAAAADARAQATYLDAEAILAETRQIHEHLDAQDVVIQALDDHMRGDGR